MHIKNMLRKTITTLIVMSFIFTNMAYSMPIKQKDTLRAMSFALNPLLQEFIQVKLNAEWKPVKIIFGTSGWRGKMSKEFTKYNVLLMAQATANCIIRDFNQEGELFIIGYDSRKNGREFAEIVARVLAANNIEVALSDRPIPTPVIAYTIFDTQAGGAINITASHNSADDNGYKYTPSHGGAAPTDVTAKLQEEANRLMQNPDFKIMDLKEAKSRGLITEFGEPIIARYINYIKGKIDFDAIKRSGLKIVATALHGTSGEYLRRIYEQQLGILDVLFQEEPNGEFPNLDENRPEANEENLKPLKAKIQQNQQKGIRTLGVATDGDADREGIVDTDGTFIEPNQLAAIFYWYQHEIKGKKGGVAKTIVTTNLLNAQAEKYGEADKLHEQQTGFKNFVDYMGRLTEHPVLVAAEESAHIALGEWESWDDGILCGLLAAEIVARTGKSLSQILDEILKDIGLYFEYNRNAKPYEQEKLDIFNKLLKENPQQIRDLFVGLVSKSKSPLVKEIALQELKTLDGIKLVFKDGSWAAFRVSGTEGRVRIYVEGIDKDKQIAGQKRDFLIAIGNEVVEAILGPEGKKAELPKQSSADTKLQNKDISELAYEAANNPDVAAQVKAQEAILEMAARKGVVLSSIKKLYVAKKSLESKLGKQFTIPSMNLRCATFDEARIIFKAAQELKAGAFQIEIAPTEVTYTGQNLKEYAISVLASAIAAGYTGPVFLKLDHMRMDPKKYKADSEKEIQRVFDVIKEAIDAGFYAIDIDASVLEKDPKEVSDPVEQQRDNFLVSARLVEMVRAYAKEKNIDLALGVEVGEVGEAYITEEHIRAFLSNLKNILETRSKELGWNIEMPDVLAIPSGTPHGGLRDPKTGEALKDVTIAFDLLEKASQICKEYGMAGPVQHGASKLPIGLFDMFAARGVTEIHLATAMSDIEIDKILSNEAREQMLNEFIASDAAKKAQATRVKQGKEPLTAEALRKNTERRKLIGKYKKAFWDIPADKKAFREKLLGELFSEWFKLLGTENTLDSIYALYPNPHRWLSPTIYPIKIEISPTEKLMGQAAARAVFEKFQQCLTENQKQGRDYVVMNFAAAPSQDAFLEAFVRILKEKGLQDYEDENYYAGKIRGVHLDEYILDNPNHKGSFKTYLKEHFVNHFDDDMQFYFMSDYTDSQYMQIINITLGGIDITCCGIGKDEPHIGFNAPGSDPNQEGIKTVPVTSAQQQFFDRPDVWSSVDDVPKQARTMTVKTILSAKTVFVIVPGAHKAEMVYLTLKSEPTPAVPSAYIKTHPDVAVFLDADSVKLWRESITSEAEKMLEQIHNFMGLPIKTKAAELNYLVSQNGLFNDWDDVFDYFASIEFTENAYQVRDIGTAIFAFTKEDGTREKLLTKDALRTGEKINGKVPPTDTVRTKVKGDEVRYANDLSVAVVDKDAILQTSNDKRPAYFMQRGIFADKDHIRLAFETPNKQRFDITILRPAAFGKEQELNHTSGHFHTPISKPEIYQVVYGKAGYMLQRTNELLEKDPIKNPEGKVENPKDVTEAIMVEAEAGEPVVILPGYGHVSTNLSPDRPLIMVNWLTWDQSSEYGPFKRDAADTQGNIIRDINGEVAGVGGACWYAVLENGKVVYKPNLSKSPGGASYKSIPALKVVKPAPEVAALGLKKGEPIYNIVNNAEAFGKLARYLNNPPTTEWFTAGEFGRVTPENVFVTENRIPSPKSEIAGYTEGELRTIAKECVRGYEGNLQAIVIKCRQTTPEAQALKERMINIMGGLQERIQRDKVMPLEEKERLVSNLTRSLAWLRSGYSSEGPGGAVFEPNESAANLLSGAIAQWGDLVSVSKGEKLLEKRAFEARISRIVEYLYTTQTRAAVVSGLAEEGPERIDKEAVNRTAEQASCMRSNIKSILYADGGALTEDKGKKDRVIYGVILPVNAAIVSQYNMSQNAIAAIYEHLGIRIAVSSSAEEGLEKLTDENITKENVIAYAFEGQSQEAVAILGKDKVFCLEQLQQEGQLAQYVPFSQMAMLAKAKLLYDRIPERQKGRYISVLTIILRGLTNREDINVDAFMANPSVFILKLLATPQGRPRPLLDPDALRQLHEQEAEMWA